MKCIVTGAAGFIGSALCRELALNGHSVLGFDNLSNLTYPSATKRQNVQDLEVDLGDKFSFMEGDLLEISKFESLIDDVEVVFHLAAVAGQSESWTKIADYTDNNVVAFNRLLSKTAPLGKKIIYASTSSVYGNSYRAHEEHSIAPISPYGITKYAAEQLVRAHSVINPFDYKILRLFSVYGPRQRPDMGIYRFIHRIMRGQDLELFGDGSALRTFTFVEDCARAMVAAAFTESKNDIFNVCGGEQITVLELISIIEEILSTKCKISFQNARIGDQFVMLGDSSRIRAELNFTELYNLRLGLKKQIEWMESIV